MKALTVLERPGLPVSLTQTLELAADFAKASDGTCDVGGLSQASFGLPKRKVIGALASLDTSEYELQHDTAAAGLGIRVSALDKLVNRWAANITALARSSSGSIARWITAVPLKNKAITRCREPETEWELICAAS